MEKIRGKSLQEWKEYCSSEKVPIKTMKYITCLEERIEQLTLSSVVCSCKDKKESSFDLGTSYCDLDRDIDNKFM